MTIYGMLPHWVRLRGWPLLLLSVPGTLAAAEGPEDPRESQEAATPFPPGWLLWDPPPECPDRAHIEARIVEWLGAGLPREAEITVGAALLWTDSGWRVDVTIVLNGRRGERHVVVRRCGDAADFVALAVALAVDPDLAPGEGVRFEDEAVGREPVDASQLSPVGNDAAVSDDADSEALPNESVAQEVPEETRARPEAHQESRVVPYLEVHTEGSLGALPEARPGFGGALGSLWGPIDLRIAGRYVPPSALVYPDALGPLEFSQLAARVSGCLELLRLDFSLAPCVSVEGGVLQAGQVGGSLNAPEVEELWLAAALGLRAGFPVARWLHVIGGLEAEVPFIRPRFVLDDGTLVHHVAPLVGRSEVGLRFFFSSR